MSFSSFRRENVSCVSHSVQPVSLWVSSSEQFASCLAFLCAFSNVCSKKEIHEECISLRKEAFLQTWFLFAVFSYCENTASSIVAGQMVSLGF